MKNVMLEGLCSNVNVEELTGRVIFVSKNSVEEGRVQKKLIIFMEFSMEGYPPPSAPLPWKIINFFPTIFKKICYVV